jgi:hypothetical protein
VRGGLGLADDSAGRVGAASYDVPVTRFVQQPDYEGAEFIDLSMASATFREVDLSGARMHGVLLFNADIDGTIDGLRVNGVEVMPLIEAELDRLHPERLRLRPTTPETMRDAVDVIEELWHATVRRASTLPEEAVYRSVNDEWSLAQTPCGGRTPRSAARRQPSARRLSACESSSATSGRTCSSPTVTWPSWKSSMRDAPRG